MSLVDATARHLRLLTDTIAAVNSSLDLQEVLELVARNVADALGTDACFVYLYDERADELVLRATHGSRVEEMTRTPRMRPGEGITGVAAAERAPVMIPAQAHLDPRFKLFPNLPEDEYESILAVPILASRPWPPTAPAGRSPAPPPADAAGSTAPSGAVQSTVPSGPALPAAPQEREARDKLEGALNVRTREPREFTDAEIELLVAIASQVAQTIEHAKLYAGAQRRVAELEALARISEAVSESLYLEESLEAIVKTTMESLHATGAALVLEDGNIAWPEGRPGAYAVRLPLRWKRRQIGELVCDRDTPFSDDDRALLEAIAHHAAVALEHGRAVMRGVLAQEIHHRVKNNLQSVASLLRVQARAENVDPRKALQDSVNRILAIAAVHEVLTEHREDDVDLRELVDRLRAMLVQGLVAGKEVTAELSPVSLAGQQATALALVFTELFQNALEHGGTRVAIELAQRNGEVSLTIADDGTGIEGERAGTGLSIVRALVRDELRGTFELHSNGGTEARVAFPV
jgi:two-component sensor histidine kinase